jgi:hypothetical protein
MEHMTGVGSAFTDTITSTNDIIDVLSKATVVATAAANKAAAAIAANKIIPVTVQQAFLFTQHAVLFYDITKLQIDWASASMKGTHLLIAAYVT